MKRLLERISHETGNHKTDGHHHRPRGGDRGRGGLPELQDYDKRLAYLAEQRQSPEDCTSIRNWDDREVCRTRAGLPIRDDGKIDREVALRWIARNIYTRDANRGAQRAWLLVRDGFAGCDAPRQWRPTEADLANLKLTRDDFERWVEGEDVFE